MIRKSSEGDLNLKEYTKGPFKKEREAIAALTQIDGFYATTYPDTLPQMYIQGLNAAVARHLEFSSDSLETYINNHIPDLYCELYGAERRCRQGETQLLDWKTIEREWRALMRGQFRTPLEIWETTHSFQRNLGSIFATWQKITNAPTGFLGQTVKDINENQLKPNDFKWKQFYRAGLLGPWGPKPTRYNGLSESRCDVEAIQAYLAMKFLENHGINMKSIFISGPNGARLFQDDYQRGFWETIETAGKQHIKNAEELKKELEQGSSQIRVSPYYSPIADPDTTSRLHAQSTAYWDAVLIDILLRLNGPRSK